MKTIKNYELINVDYGYCDECSNYKVVNTYKKPYVCPCNACKDRHLTEIKSICGKCLEISLTNGTK